MKRAAVAALVGAVSACSLLTSLDGLSGGGGSAGGEAGGGDAQLPVDGGREGASIDAADGGESDGATRSSLYASAVLADKPIGYWRLEETTGTVARDETGRRNGTFVNAPLLGEPGVAGSRATRMLNDTDARMFVPGGDYRFPGNAPHTIELWVKAGVFRDYAWLGGTEVNAPTRSGWSLLADNAGVLRYEVWHPISDGGKTQVRGLEVSPVPITAGTFKHVVLAYTGSVANGYVNGVETTSFPTTGVSPDTGELLWGCRPDLAHCMDEWVIDELAIYDFALSAARVKAHHDLGK